ncbi:snRNA-activating protein complex subunit 4 [Mantella aurantiaca]
MQGAMAALDLNAERDKIQREIEALERSLGPNVAAINVDESDSHDDSDDDFEEQLDGDDQTDDVIWEGDGSSAEVCLQMNLVYQAVIEEKLQELEVLIAQNKEQQEELMWELAGRKTQRAGATKVYPLNLALGHFMKPYFKDKVSGLGPPANTEMKERSMHIVKDFKELNSKKWRPVDTLELRKAIFSDTLQRMLQPKILKLEYLQQKRDKAKSDIDKKIITNQIHEAESEIDDVNQLTEEVLLGQINDAHDWDKISNINFEGIYTPERLCRIWQNSEHPHISQEVWSVEEIQKLKEIAKDHNFVDWQAIAQELGTKRTAFQCLQMFQSNNKEFKRSEFNKEEDEMLIHFIQRMRVGEHIPYNKISYFMEGRDGLQLLHRWSKCLDPRKKRGHWSKEEDEMLLKAVAKHGEKDWYKIRKEVPGRNDIQCRERYLKALHKDVKKGKWSEEEKDKLLELTVKYGIGHWAKVSRELPHRTSSQCLSKWKLITGYFKRKRQMLKRAKKRQSKLPRSQKSLQATKVKKEMGSEDELSSGSSSSVNDMISSSSSSSSSSNRNNRSRSSSSSSSSSSESEDEAMELMDHFRESEISNLLKSVPDLDRWIPKKKRPGSQAKSLLVYAPPSRKPSGKKKRKRNEKPFQFNTILKGIAYPPSTDTVTETVEDFLKEAEEKGREILQVQEEDTINIIRRNTRQSERKKIQRFKQRHAKPLPDSDINQHKDSGTPLSQLIATRLYKPSLDRKLLCAVTRWVGNVLLPLPTSNGRRSRRRTQADEMNKKLSCVTITSTPIFTLLIQFFQIDADGCLQMIRQRNVDESEFFKRVKNTTKKISRRTANSDPMSPKSILVRSYSDDNPNPVSSKMTTEITPTPPQKRLHSLPKTPKVSSPVPAPKLKTVYELLQEKRLQKSNATKAIQRTAVMSGNILVPPQILIQQSANSVQTLQPQTMMLPMAPTTSQAGSWPIRSFSPRPRCQVVTMNNVTANQMSPVSGGPIIRQVANSTRSVHQRAGAQRTDQSRSSSVPPTTQLFSHPVTLLPRTLFPVPSHSAIPMTILVTPQGLISIPTQALPYPNLIQQSGNLSPTIVSTPLNTAATGTFVTGLSNGIINAPSHTIHGPAQPLSATTSSKKQQSTVTSSPIRCSQASGTHLPMLAPRETSSKSSLILPAVTSHSNQDGTSAISLVGSQPKVAVPHLPTSAATEVSKMPSLALSTITSSLRHEGMATTSSVVSSPLVAGSGLPMSAPSDASKMISQTLPATTSSLTQEGTEMIALVESQLQPTGSLPTVTPLSTSKVKCQILPDRVSSLTQVDTSVLSPVKASSHLPVHAPSLVEVSSHLPVHAPSLVEVSSHLPVHARSLVEASSHLPVHSSSPVEASSHLPVHAPSPVEASSRLPLHAPSPVEASSRLPVHAPSSVEASSRLPLHAPSPVEASSRLPLHAPSPVEASSGLPVHAPSPVEASSRLPVRDPSPVEASSHLPVHAPSLVEASSHLPVHAPSPREASSRLPAHAPSQREASSRLPAHAPSPVEASSHLPVRTPSPVEASSGLPVHAPSPVEASSRLPVHAPSPVEASSRLPVYAPSPVETSSRLPVHAPSPVEASSRLPVHAPSPVEASSHLPVHAPSPVEASSHLPVHAPSLVVASSHLPVHAPSPVVASSHLPVHAPSPVEASSHLPVHAPSLVVASSHLPVHAPSPVEASSHLPVHAPSLVVASSHLPVHAPSLVVASSHLPVHAPSPVVASSHLPVHAPSPVEASSHLPVHAPSLVVASSHLPVHAPSPVVASSHLPVHAPSPVEASSHLPVHSPSPVETSSHLPVHAPSKAYMMPSQMLPVITSSSKQEGTLVASSVTSQPSLDSASLPKFAGLPDKASQLKLTPQKYPIVRITKLLHTDYPKEDTANVKSDLPCNPVPDNSNQTANSERNLLDVKLISLEEETNVKEWLQGKQGASNQKSAIPYLPPSICTLKTFSNLLLEKKTLEEKAFKLLPNFGVTKVSSKQMRATLSDVVEERLKDNLAYQLIKQRFLSAFTIPGFLAVLPPTSDRIKQGDSNEDIEDFMDSEMNMVEGAHKDNDAAADGDSVDNISTEATSTLAEQETALHCSAENSDGIDNMERLLTRRSVYCRSVT